MMWLRGPAHAPYATWIADRIAEAIESGALHPDDRLPPQRDVARLLGVDLTTVTRGYREAKTRGLIDGQAGRGTFVKGRAHGRTIDLAMNLPPPLPPDITREALQIAANVTRARTSALVEYTSVSRRSLDAAAAWLQRHRMPAQPDAIVVTSGATHALALVAGVLRPDHRVMLVESATYAAFREIAASLGIQLVPVDMDEDGVIPSSITRQARRHRATAAYLMPTMQNPTGITMSDRRRDAVAEALLQARLFLVEDDVYGALLPRLSTPLAARMNGRAVFISSLSKTMAAGVRVGFAVAPPDIARRLREAVRLSVFTAASIGVEVATSWIETGIAERMLSARRAEMQRRYRIARGILAPRHELPASPCFHVWLRLAVPETEFVAHALARGVAVARGSMFAIDGHGPAVRVSLGAAASATDLLAALTTLSAVEESEPRAASL